MALTLRGLHRESGQMEDTAERRNSMRQGLGQEHASFREEKVEVWLRGVVRNGEWERHLEIRGYSQIMDTLECHAN